MATYGSADEPLIMTKLAFPAKKKSSFLNFYILHFLFNTIPKYHEPNKMEHRPDALGNYF